MLRALGLITLGLLAQPATAQEEVELELVLLADSSGSIDTAEILFQRQGYASAITDPAVLAAIANTAYGRIAVSYVEWGQSDSQDVVVPWRIIAGPEDAADFAGALMEPPRRAFGRNGIGAALIFGRDLIEANAITGWRRIIDFSADSTGNFNGPSIAEGRAAVLAAGITINGLAVACRQCPTGGGDGRALAAEFAERFIGGPGAFVIAAEGGQAFAEAVRRKLILEISGRPLAAPLVAAADTAGPIPPAALAAIRARH